MNINEILKGIDCACGKRHICRIEAVYIERGAIAHLAQLCVAYKKLLLVADENTYAAAGAQTELALSGKVFDKVIFSGKTVLIPNEAAIDAVTEKLAGVDLIIGIGSGVIQDLCKCVSNRNGVPYMVVATAPSMDGYASDGAAMILGGMKVTEKAGLPKAIVADTQVLANAPYEMLQAGYGDIIGKYSALNDWKLSRVVNDEYFCDYIYDTTYAQVEAMVEAAKGIAERNEESVKKMMEALVIVGIMMSFAGSSRPASGSEHHLSHYFEIVGIEKNEPYLAHGIDVVYSTVATAALREKLLSKAFPDAIYREEREVYINKMQAIYGSAAKGCIELQDKVGNYAANRLPIYKAKEDKIRAVLSEMPKAEKLQELLALVGLDMKAFTGLYGEEKIKNAILYAKELKDRYTVLWLYYDLFGGEDL